MGKNKNNNSHNSGSTPRANNGAIPKDPSLKKTPKRTNPSETIQMEIPHEDPIHHADLSSSGVISGILKVQTGIEHNDPKIVNKLKARIEDREAKAPGTYPAHFNDLLEVDRSDLIKDTGDIASQAETLAEYLDDIDIIGSIQLETMDDNAENINQSVLAEQNNPNTPLLQRSLDKETPPSSINDILPEPLKLPVGNQTPKNAAPQLDDRHHGRRSLFEDCLPGPGGSLNSVDIAYLNNCFIRLYVHQRYYDEKRAEEMDDVGQALQALAEGMNRQYEAMDTLEKRLTSMQAVMTSALPDITLLNGQMESMSSALSDLSHEIRVQSQLLRGSGISVPPPRSTRDVEENAGEGVKGAEASSDQENPLIRDHIVTQLGRSFKEHPQYQGLVAEMFTCGKADRMKEFADMIGFKMSDCLLKKWLEFDYKDGPKGQKMLEEVWKDLRILSVELAKKPVPRTKGVVHTNTVKCPALSKTVSLPGSITNVAQPTKSACANIWDEMDDY